MTPEVTGGGPPGDEEAGLGEPVVALRHLSLDVDQGFGRRIRGRIERRHLAGDLIGLAWTAPVVMLFELLRAPFEWLAGTRRR